MSWRIHRDESHFSGAQKLAWKFVLPQMHVPILDSEHHEANSLTGFLSKHFSKQALKAAVKRMEAK